jgi:hypothetical protein
MANGVCQVKKYIPTVDPLFAVILQAYKKVKVGKRGFPIKMPNNDSSELKCNQLKTSQANQRTPMN